MIAREQTSGFLARFVQELEAQSPLELLEGTVDLTRFDPDELETARLVWARRIVDEYRSIVVFSELLRLLADAGAPFAALCAVQRLLGDELRHTQLCARVVGWLGGGELGLDLEGLGLPRSPRTSAARAYELVVRELVIAEGESVHIIRAQRDAATEPAIRRVLEIMLRDEARHFVAGRELQALLEETFPPGELEAVKRELPALVARDLEHIRGGYREMATDGPGRALGASIRADELAFS